MQFNNLFIILTSVSFESQYLFSPIHRVAIAVNDHAYYNEGSLDMESIWWFYIVTTLGYYIVKILCYIPVVCVLVENIC